MKSRYEESLKEILERVEMRGNADKLTIRSLAAIFWDIDSRLNALEESKPAVAAAPVVEEPVVEVPKNKVAGASDPIEDTKAKAAKATRGRTASK